YAVPTPTTDGTHVFALFGSGVVAALDFEGKIVWREELPRKRDVDGGICSSPVLYGDLLILPGLAEPGLRALEKKTGKMKWEQKTRDRNNMPTPALLKIGDKTQLIHYAGGIQSLDPDTGELLWFCRAPTVSYSSPAYGAGLLYADAGRGGQTGTAVDPTGKGDVSKTHVKWQVKTDSAAGSPPIFLGGNLYPNPDPGLVRCLQAGAGGLVHGGRTARIPPHSP